MRIEKANGGPRCVIEINSGKFENGVLNLNSV